MFNKYIDRCPGHPLISTFLLRSLRGIWGLWLGSVRKLWKIVVIIVVVMEIMVSRAKLRIRIAVNLVIAKYGVILEIN